MRTIMLFSALSLVLSPLTSAVLPMQAQTPTWGLPSVQGGGLPGSRAWAFAPMAEAMAPYRMATAAAGSAISYVSPCRTAGMQYGGSPMADSGEEAREPCLGTTNPYQRFVDTDDPLPLTPEQKAHFAFHNVKDAGNLVTILGTAGFTIGSDAHTAYGPGWRGFGRNVGYSVLQDTTWEFFGTFLIPSLVHEDPHYHRMPQANFSHRFVHAISRTVIAQSDYGTPMPNYSTLLTSPITAELGNLYVPGMDGSRRSTAERVMTGYATDSAGNLLAEFLPDVAKHLHIEIIFVQRILNRVANEQ